ncbi:MAG: hypothetical protein H0V18_20830 [Pyrinomonadaceae bacterium]|nr:hypothetical protein [Pyrinomonadaceae bacterium]
MANDLNALLRRAITKAAAPYTRVMKNNRRRERISSSRRERLYTRNSEMSVRSAAYKVMERAYMAASAQNTLPANARQIMYRARPLIQELTDKMWTNSSYFTQTLLPDFIKAHRELTSTWDVVYDARGHIEEPHTAKRVDLGTLAVRRYTNDWVTQIPSLTLDHVELGINTVGPGNRYKFALFIEKEGFDALLSRSTIKERYDMAVMSCKGMSVTAGRQLVESLSEEGVTILVAHDCDKSGFSICHTLHTDTRRFTFDSAPNVKCLGLRLDDARRMGLASESVSYRKRAYKDRLRECGATVEECDFIIGDRKKGTRIELNAMDSQQFIDWLELKFAEHGVTKVVPNQATLEAAYKRAILVMLANDAIGSVQSAWNENGHGVSIPDDLEQQVRIQVEGTELSWDAAIMKLLPLDPKPAQKKVKHKRAKPRK